MRALRHFAVTIFACAPLAAQAPDAPSLIRTSGRGSQPVTPDRVTISVSVSTKARTPSGSGAANARVASAIRAAIASLGIAPDSITTQGYSVELTTDPYGRDTGYVSTNTVLVRLRHLALIGRVIDTALTAGATRLTGVTYTADDVSRPALRALEQAVADARAKAEVMAKASGGKLGRLVLLTTEPTASPELGNILVPRDFSDAAAEATSITPSPLRVSAWALGQWEFVPAQ